MDEEKPERRSPPETVTGVKRLKYRNLSSELSNVFTLEEIKAEVQCLKLFKDCLGGQSGYTTKVSYFNRMCGEERFGAICSRQLPVALMSYSHSRIGLNRLNTFLGHCTKKEALSKDVRLLVWCCLSLLSFYNSKRQEEECSCYKIQILHRCRNLYRNTLYLVLPEKQEDVIKHTIYYMSLTSQWNSDDYDSFVFQELFVIITKPELLIAKLIKNVETSQRDDKLRKAFDICCTLSNILENAHWDKYLFNTLLHNCLNTLLKLYLLCNTTGPSSVNIENVKLRMIIKTCIKYFISNIRDNKGLVSVLDSFAKCLQDTTIAEDDRMEILEMIIICAQKHNAKFYRESITPDLLDLLLRNLLSKDRMIAVTSHKIFQHLLDRNNNEKYFTEPVYFFKGRCNFFINGDYSVEDVHFFKSFFKKFLDGIHHCFLTFTEKYCLTMCYLTLCLILVEMPEPVITINIIHVLITAQNDVLKSDDLTLTIKAQCHAIIAAVVSLVCIVHQEEVAPLKKYVEEVVRFRTENSPHLLPPLQNKYNVASHHTVEYHDQLYFLEDEILYALQRCWLGKRATGSR